MRREGHEMLPYIHDMRARLTEVDNTQQALIQALAEALARVEQKLLDDVRSLTMDHEARRVAILTELHNLSVRFQHHGTRYRGWRMPRRVSRPTCQWKRRKRSTGAKRSAISRATS